MKNILFPTDFSAPAQNAFHYALNVAHALGASITTLHVYSKPDVSAIHLPPSLQKEYDRIDVEEFENFRSEVPSLSDVARQIGREDIEVRHAMQPMIKKFKVHEVIVKYARENGFDLIVMGTHAHNEVEDALFGSTAESVMEEARVPVLVVPDSASSDGKLDHIAMAYNFEPEVERHVEDFLHFTDPFHGTLEIVHVDTSHTEDLTHRMDAIKRHFATNERIRFRVVEGDELVESFSKYAAENQIDIIALFSERRGFFEELFHYNKAKKLVETGDVPVLAIPKRN